MIVVIVLAMFVNMVPLFGGLHCQQHKFALIFVISAIAKETNSPPLYIRISRVALVFASKFLHFVITGECLQECPFNVVGCAINF
jgi:hypothetical protein